MLKNIKIINIGKVKMENQIWYNIQKNMPPVKSVLENTSFELACMESENVLQKYLNDQQLAFYNKFKDSLNSYLEELIYQYSGLAFTKGLKYGMEMKNCFDEIDK